VGAGMSVIGVDRRHFVDCPCRFVLSELSDRMRIQSVLEQVDAVVHLGEIPSLTRSHRPEEVFALNTAAGTCVMQAVSDLKLRRIVYASSCQVYGFSFGLSVNPNPGIVPQKLPFDETHPLRPNNAYGAGKIANEMYASMLAEQEGISVAILRFPGVFWHPKDDPVWIRMQQSNRHLEGLATYVHLDDAARAILAALQHDRGGCEAYNIAAEDTLVPLRPMLRDFHPDYPPLPPDWPDRRSVMLCEKAFSHFGWKPRFELPLV
jgi:nucleoside-diphosphate-sugar epimerase